MHALDNAFFEEYKRLDKLCSEIYSCKNGISEYIADMEDKTYQGQARVPSWNADYKMLKHVRWVRTQIAHEPGTYMVSQPSDLAFVQDFYDRIFSGEDPLTLYRKATNADRSRAQEKQQKPISRSLAPEYSPPPEESHKKPGGWIAVIVGIGIIALILVYFFLKR